MADIAVFMQRNRGEEIYGSDCPGIYWYRVASGAARSYVLLPNGRRRILDLLLPGNFFKFTPCGGHYYALDAVVDGTVVACYAANKLEKLADSDSAVGHEVREMAFETIARLQELVLILGRIKARQKVGSFLLKMTDRVSGERADRVILSASRCDIADYLALSVETVSRSLTDLKNSGCIALSGPRRVRIIDRQRLADEESIDYDYDVRHGSI